MRRIILLTLSIGFASFFAGCEDAPRYHASDRQSLTKLKLGLTETEKNQLGEDLKEIGAAAIEKAKQSGDPKAFPKNVNEDADGLTVAEIHAKAEAIRASKKH